MLKVQISTQDGPRDHDYGFRISQAQDRALQGPDLDGLVLLPCRGSKDDPRPALDAPLAVIVPADDLYAEGGLARDAVEGHENLSLHLEPRGQGWQLRLPNADGTGRRSAVAPLARDRRRSGLVLRLRANAWESA